MLQVFLYVSSATVDLSVFGSDQASLIRSLRSAHRSLHFRPLPRQRKATVEGPFAAVQALREDLIRRAGHSPQSTVTAPTAAAKLKETSLNPRVTPHREFVGSVSRSASKAEPEPESSNSLSTPPQTTGEATGVQSLSNAKTRSTPSRQKVSQQSLAVRSFGDTDDDEVEEWRPRTTLEMPSEYRTERAEANTRQVFGEEINAGIRSSLSGRDLLPTEEISQKHTRADRISATKIRGENHSGSRYSSADYLKQSDQSSSAVTAKLLQTRLADAALSSRSDTTDTEEPSAVCPEDTCIWFDLYTLRYIEKYDKEEFDRCLGGLGASAECVEGTDLVRISLTDRRASKAAPGFQTALGKLKTLVGLRLSTLRVHEIRYDEEEHPDKQKLIRICDDENFFKDVLYVFEDSRIKVIGPSVSSHLFYKRVEDRLHKVKGTQSKSLTMYQLEQK